MRTPSSSSFTSIQRFLLSISHLGVPCPSLSPLSQSQPRGKLISGTPGTKMVAIWRAHCPVDQSGSVLVDTMPSVVVLKLLLARVSLSLFDRCLSEWTGLRS